jgi:hypothetical protein
LIRPGDRPFVRLAARQFTFLYSQLNPLIASSTHSTVTRCANLLLQP